MPSGAGGLPAVKPLPLAAMPASPAKAQGEPVGRYRNWPAPTATCSKPRVGGRGVRPAIEHGRRASTKAVLSPPAVFSPWNVTCATRR